MNPHRMIAAARAIERQTQAQLARKLTAISGEEWNRNDVAGIENGRRKFEARHLTLFAAAQNRPLSWYLEGDTRVTTGDGNAPSHGTRPIFASTAEAAA
jgi:transcriptional regulator with XRE-family HTH domain